MQHVRLSSGYDQLKTDLLNACRQDLKYQIIFTWVRMAKIRQILPLVPRRHPWQRQALVVRHIRHVAGKIHLVGIQDLLENPRRWDNRVRPRGMWLTHRKRRWPRRVCVNPVTWLFKARGD